MRNNGQDLERMFHAYVECALWSSTDEEGNALDSDSDHGSESVAPATLDEMRADCADFLESNEADLSGMSPEQAGHDFWLTRNRHGAGFWDRDIGEAGRLLTDACAEFGEVYLYVGDDGKIHQ